MNIVETAVQWALKVANDNSHGYDQTRRQGPDYDCSSLVINAFKRAGIPLTCTYTGTMHDDFLANHFVDVTKMINLSTGAGLQRGDVLLRHRNGNDGHTAIYIGNGQIVHASGNEFGGATGGKTGDQTGKEICVRSYYNSPWGWVLRYGDALSNAPNALSNETKGADDMPLIVCGMAGYHVKVMQTLLELNGFKCGLSGTDGEYGTATRNALIGFQKKNGLEPDAECGPLTWSRLLHG